MKKLFLVVFLCATLLFIGNTASAYNILQLDIPGGKYIGDTTYGGPSGDLYAFLNPDAGSFKNGSATLSNWYYISLAVVPSTNVDPTQDPGFSAAVANSFSINLGTSTDGQYGTPNLLPTHSAFDTWYWEYRFKFTGDTSAQFDAQTDGFPSIPEAPGDKFFYYAKFNYDASALLALGFDEIHFDLYTYDDGKIIKAPFSHDASAVPEPATLLLLGGGLVGLAGFGRKKFKK